MKRVLAVLLILTLLVTCAPLSLAAGTDTAVPETAAYVANEVLITQRTDVKVTSALPVTRAEIIDTSALDSNSDERVLQATVPYGTDIEALCESLEARADVLCAEPNYVQHLDSITVPTEAEKTTSDYNAFNWYRDALQLTDAWQSADTLGSADITVAVIDTGVNTAHREFEGALWDDEGGYNAVNDSNDVTDTNGHGTNVAGIIAMRANRYGYVGIAPQVKIMPLKATNSDAMTDARILKCLNYALEHGADIINLSYSGTSLSATMATAYQRAASKAVLIAAAGNNGADAAVSPEYPAACSGIIGVMSYGSYKNADLTNYTIDKGELSSFSNYDKTGEYYQIAAPGVEITGPSHKNTTGFSTYSGTSQATPIVAGTAALYMSLHPEATPYQVRQALIENSRKQIRGYYTDTMYRRLNMSAILADTPCDDPVVALSDDALALLSACLDTPLSEAHLSDTDALHIIPASSARNYKADLRVLAELNRVQVLELDGLNLTNEQMSRLAGASFPRLYRLDISNNPALSQLPFSETTAPLLNELYMDNCAFESTDSVPAAAHLYTLSAGGNRFFSSRQFEKFKQVYEINLSSCRLQDVAVFADFENLRYLDVSDNYICDISPLACFRGNYLNINANPLRLGASQTYAVKSIARFMNDNPCRYGEISFSHKNTNADDGKTYQKASALSAPTLTLARSEAQATVRVNTTPADANVAAACLFTTDSSIVKLNSFTGELAWSPAAIAQTTDVPVTVTPVSTFAAFATTVRLLVPEITQFTFADGSFTLRANKATETVRLGALTLDNYTEIGEERSFEVPASTVYIDTLTAIPADRLGDGEAAAVGTRQPENIAAAKVLAFTSDKAAYRTGDTALLTVRTNSAANYVKLKDAVQHTEIVTAACTETADMKEFTFTVPVSAATDYKYKAYASADGTFGIGAKVLTFTSTPAATDITLSSESGNTLYFTDGCDSLRLQTAVYPASAAGTTAITLTSADEQIARVAQDGTVSAVGYGSTVITATSDNGLSTSFPLFVAAPKMSPVEVTEGNWNDVSYLECYTKGATQVVLKNADGSDVEFYYETEADDSTIDGYDTYHIFALHTTSAAPLALRVYALDRNGMNAHSQYLSANVTPTVPVQSFEFKESSYTFDRNGGAVTIALNVLPAGASDYFNWALSNNTVASITGYADYCVLTPKKAGTVRLTASVTVDGEEMTKSVNVTFSEGQIYSATLAKTTGYCYEPIEVEVVTDTAVKYINLTDTDNGLSEEFASYTFFEDSGDRRTWHVPFTFKRESSHLQISGGDSKGNLSTAINKEVSITMPEENFAANPAVVKGNAGTNVAFNLITLPSRANISYGSYTVSSDNADIASFNLGTLRLNGEGETTLHCVYGEQQKDVRVIVANPVERITFDETALTLDEGETLALQPHLTPDSREPLTYSSSDIGTATVDANGLVVALHEGTAVITARSAGGVSATVTVKVKSPQVITTLRFEQEHYTAQAGETITCSLLSNVSSLQNKLTFFASNTNIVSVGENGTFTALKEGTVTISALSDSGITACAQLTVTAQRVLTLSREHIQATVKDFIAIMPLISPDNADVDGIWYSDNEAVAAITQGGYLSAKSPGSCNIIFVSEQGEIATCSVDVYNTNAAKMTMGADTLTLALGENHIISYSLSPSFTSEMPRFHSSDSGVAAVDENGIIYAVGKGSTVITATLNNGNMYPIAVQVTAETISLSGNTDTTASLQAENVTGAVSDYTVQNRFTLENVEVGTYRFTFSAPHHTTLTVEDATLFASADLGNIHLYNGDANGDGVVDIADITMLLKEGTFGASSSAAGAALDINDDGAITIADINEVLLAENYGGTNETIIY